MNRDRLPHAVRRAPRDHGRWQFSLFALFAVTTLSAVLLSTWKTWPMETLVVGGIVAGAALAIALYVGELVVIGWFLDLPMRLAELALHSAHVPLEFEQQGEITVVKLSENIASLRECRSVQQQLDRLIAAGHCNLVLDFSAIKKLTSGFREVLISTGQAARTAAAKTGKPRLDAQPAAGSPFLVFPDRAAALEEMSRHAGRGWVVLCAVAVGIRAVE